MIAPPPIQDAILNTATAYAFYYSNELDVVNAPWSVTNCHVVARRIACKWTVRITSHRSLMAEATGTVTQNAAKHVEVYGYDTESRRGKHR